MSNIIAVIWDFDKTLIDGYMQAPLFEEYNVKGRDFWDEVNALPQTYREKGILVNKDTIYLNHILKYVRDGRFKGLNNEKLKSYGSMQHFYAGAIDLIKYTNEFPLHSEYGSKYQEYNIKVENYIVSTGMRKILEGTDLWMKKWVKGIWGCELIDELNPETQEVELQDIGFTIDNTSKTRALFEINKGIPLHPEIDVNAKVQESSRRVKFNHMIYIADGPSDVPAFSVVKKFGGATFAVYPHGNQEALNQVEKLREDGRVDMYAEADYSEGTTAYMWITHKIEEFANQIYKEERERLAASVSEVPHHLTK